MKQHEEPARRARLTRGIIILICLLLPSTDAMAQKIGAVRRVAVSAKAPRGEALEWTSPAGRPYWYRLPKKISKASPPNLLLMLHGTGLNHGWSFWNYGLTKGTFRKDDIVVSPDGVTPGQGSTFNFVQNKNDGDQMVGLIKTFKKTFPIRNVYLYGHSQGAFFCYWFAGEHPDLVDGIVAHAGNVLSVKHTKLAKKKVAIGILHAASDQVVSVECARRSHKIYEDAGYSKLKLNIIEGIRPQAGHWPLPAQVSEMLAWCDRVCAASVEAGLDIATSEIGKELPQLTIIAAALATAERLLKKRKGSEKKGLKSTMDSFKAFMQWNEAAHANALTEGPSGQSSRKEYGSWAAHFRAVHPALRTRPAWKKALGPLTAQAARESKRLAKALKALTKKPGKGFRGAFRTWTDCFLGEGYEDLTATLARLAATPPKGTNKKDVTAFNKLLATRKAIDTTGAEAAASITAELATRHRAESLH